MTDLIRGPITVGEWQQNDEDGVYPVTFRVALRDERASSLFFEVASKIISAMIPTGDPGPESGGDDESDDLTVMTFYAPPAFFVEKDPRWLRDRLERAAAQANAEGEAVESRERRQVDAWLAEFKREGDDE